MLDEFSKPKPSATTARAATGAGAGSSGDNIGLDEDWARMLQEGMADLLSDVNESPEMQGQFEKLAKELNDAMVSTTTPATDSTTTASTTTTAAAAAAVGAAAAAAGAGAGVGGAAVENFQDRIKQTMERMKSSNAEVDAGLAGTEEDDFLAEMLKSMGGGGKGGSSSGGGGGEGGEDDFSNMLVNMMEQLTSKEILYEPMKELCEKYPEWIRVNEGKQSREDMARFREQFAIVKDIVLKFEEPGYKDENDEHREYIVERMQKVSPTATVHCYYCCYYYYCYYYHYYCCLGDC